MEHSNQEKVAVEDRRIESNRATAREVLRVVDQKSVSKGILTNQNLSLIVIVMLSINTVLSTITFVDFSMAHNSAVIDRHQMMNDIETLKSSRVDENTFEKKMEEMSDKTDKLMLFGTDVAKRQAINEANIEINHAALKKITEVLPTTQPINLPDPLPLPPK